MLNKFINSFSAWLSPEDLDFTIWDVFAVLWKTVLVSNWVNFLAYFLSTRSQGLEALLETGAISVPFNGSWWLILDTTPLKAS